MKPGLYCPLGNTGYSCVITIICEETYNLCIKED